MVGNSEILVYFATDRLPVVGAEDMVDSDIHAEVTVGEAHPIASLPVAVVELFAEGVVCIRCGRTVEVATQHDRCPLMFFQCPGNEVCLKGAHPSGTGYFRNK